MRTAVITARRDGRRTLCAAEGVLAVLRHCSLDDAFVDIVDTAAHHNIAPLRLAEALVARAQCESAPGVDHKALGVVEQTWGALLKSARLLTAAITPGPGPALSN